MIPVFKKVSQLLTGFDDLPGDLVQSYYDRLSTTPGYKEEIQKLLELTSGKAELDLSTLLSIESINKRLFKGITFLWYTSELIMWDHLDSDATLFQKSDNRYPGTENEYYSGLIWRAIRAHPLGLSGGYYGYWKYEPEN